MVLQNVSTYCNITQCHSPEDLDLNMSEHVLYGCRTWSLILRDKYRLRGFENRLLREYLGLRVKKWPEAGEDRMVRSFINCTLHPTLFKQSN
jgi:hypothetical protein